MSLENLLTPKTTGKRGNIKVIERLPARFSIEVMDNNVVEVRAMNRQGKMALIARLANKANGIQLNRVREVNARLMMVTTLLEKLGPDVVEMEE